MLTRPRTSLALIAVMLSFLGAPAAALARDAFVGTWNVVVTPDEDARNAGEKAFKDTFTFKGSQFESKAFKAHGFSPVQYEEDTRAGLVATFKANAKSTKGKGETTWTGTSTAGEMQGELIWKKTDGTELKYTMTGTRKQ